MSGDHFMVSYILYMKYGSYIILFFWGTLGWCSLPKTSEADSSPKKEFWGTKHLAPGATARFCNSLSHPASYLSNKMVVVKILLHTLYLIKVMMSLAGGDFQ